MSTQKKIGFLGAVMMGVNFMVGAGAFFGIQRLTQTFSCSPHIAWLLGLAAIFPLAGAIIFASMRQPDSDGLYSFTISAAGKLAANFVGFSYAVAIASVSSLFVVEAAKSFVSLVPSLDQTLASAVTALLVLVLSIAGIRTISWAQTLGAVLKLSLLIAIPVIAIFVHNGNLCLYHSAASGRMLDALQLGIFGYWGFDVAISVSKKVEGRTWLAVLVALFLTASLYVMFSAASVAIAGVDAISKNGIFAVFNAIGISNIATVFSAALSVFYLASAVTAVFSASSMAAAPIEGSVSTDRRKLEQFFKIVISTAAFLLSLCRGITFLLVAFINVGVSAAMLGALLSMAIKAIKIRDKLGATVFLAGTASTLIITWFSVTSLGNSVISRVGLVALALTIPATLAALTARRRTAE